MHTQAAAQLASSDLTPYFDGASCGAKPLTVGVEIETPGVFKHNGEALPLEGPVSVETVFDHLVRRFGWKAEPYGGTVFLHRGDDGVISLEPGGQIELSTPHAASHEEVLRKQSRHLAELKQIGDDLGILWLGLGAQPVTPPDQIGWVPKRRYSLMRDYFRSKGRLAHAMMKQTASIQINLDYTCEEDAAEKVSMLARITPLLTALFANSCVAQGRLTGFKSYRSHIWQNTDADRCGIPDCFFKEDFRFSDWAEYALDVPMFFIEREGKLIGGLGMTFRMFLKQGFGQYRAAMTDWELHLSCLFPEIRIKRWIEVRSIDRQSGAMSVAAQTLVRALVYDKDARGRARSLFGGLKRADCLAALASAARYGLQGEMGGFRISDLANEIVRIGSDALKRLEASTGQRDAMALLAEEAEQRRCPADAMIQQVESRADLLDALAARSV